MLQSDNVFPIITSPLRYPGAKRRLGNYISETLKLNALRPALFIEPFSGSASVSLTLLSLDQVDYVGIADKDPLISSFWKVVFWDTDWLIDQIENIEITVDRWKQMHVSVPESDRERALKCLFLNRTSFSGIIAAGSGPIGGFQQISPYKIDCRFPRKTLIKRVRQIQSLAPRVSFVWDTPWQKTLNDVLTLSQQGTLPDGIFYYFDPPFFEKADRLYNYWFESSEHLGFRDSVKRLDVPWIVSYDSVPKAEELYGNHYHNGTIVKCLYSLARGKGVRESKEAIITNLKTLPTRTHLWRSRSNQINTIEEESYGS